MSAIQTLPPDQRAVLQLILKQGRGYADLSHLLRIDEAAVRERAHAGLAALAPAGAGDALSDERRAQIGDWLLGQQEPRERAETLQHLEDSRAARRFARALHEQLSPFANETLPELPDGPATADSAPADAPVAPADDADDDAAGPPAPAAPAERPARPPRPPRPAPTPTPPADRGPRRGSLIGGALLIVGAAAVLVVVIVLLVNNVFGDDGDDGSAAVATTPTTAQTQSADGRTTASRAEDDTQILQQVNLRATDGARTPLGIAFILVREARPVVAVQVEGIAANAEDDVYAAWLRRSADGGARFLGYFPGQVGAEQRFTVSAPLPRDTAQFDQVVISRESIDVRTAPSRPSSILLQGTIRVNRTG